VSHIFLTDNLDETLNLQRLIKYNLIFNKAIPTKPTYNYSPYDYTYYKIYYYNTPHLNVFHFIHVDTYCLLTYRNKNFQIQQDSQFNIEGLFL